MYHKQIFGSLLRKCCQAQLLKRDLFLRMQLVPKQRTEISKKRDKSTALCVKIKGQIKEAKETGFSKLQVRASLDAKHIFLINKNQDVL